MAWTTVQQSAAQTVNATNTLPANSTAGNLLIAVVGCSSVTALVPPTGQGTWASVITITGTSSEVTIFANFNNPGGLSSFTFTGGTAPISVSVAEFTCPGIANVVAASATGSATANKVASVTVTNGATEIAGDLVIVGATQHITAAAITWTNPAGVSQFSSLSIASAAQHTYAGLDLAGTGASQAATVTSSVTSTANGSWTGVIASFTGPEVVKPLQGPVQVAKAPLTRMLAGRAAGKTGTFTAVAGPAGPPVYPLQGPVGSKIRQALPPRGRARGTAGVFDNVGPVFVPPSTPSGVRVIQVHAGRVIFTPPYVLPAAGVTTPAPVYPLRRPVAAVSRPLPLRGKVSTRAGIFQGTGPAAAPLPKPVQAKTPLARLLGRTASRTGIFTATGVSGPPVYPLHGPVGPGGTSQGPVDVTGIPASQRGRVRNNRGVYGQLGPPVKPLSQPSTAIAATIRPLPQRGRCMTVVATAFMLTGPPVYPLHGPVQAKVPLARPPGKTATRSGVFTATAIVSGPPVYPLHGPVRSRIPAPLRGSTARRAGIFQGTGPAVKALSTPPPIQRPLPARGRVSTRSGIFQGTGPPVRQLPAPVAAVIRPLPVRGKVRTLAGAFGGLGPAVRALAAPVRAAWPAAVRIARVAGRAGTFSQLGPPVTPQQRPVQAKTPLSRLLGRTASRAGTFTATAIVSGPPVYPLHGPVRAAWPATVRYARVLSRAGALGVTGPPVIPLHHPVQARVPLTRSLGRTVSRTGVFTATVPVSGPPVYPLQGPVRSRIPAPPRPGSAASRAGIFQGTGAVPIPLHQPVRVIRPAVAFRKGSTAGVAGPLGGTGPRVRPLPGPVSIRRPAPPRPGSATGRSGTVAPPVSGPPVYPLRGPVSIRRPAPPRPGSGAGRSGTFTPPVSGPPVYPLHRPAGNPSRLRGPYRSGRSRSSSLSVPPTRFINLIVGVPQAKWRTKTVRLRWVTDPPKAKWADKIPGGSV